MKSIEVKGTARTIAERSSEQARALKEIRKNGGVPCVLYGAGEVVHFTVTKVRHSVSQLPVQSLGNRLFSCLMRPLPHSMLQQKEMFLKIL